MMMNHSARSNLLDFADRQCLMLSSVPSIFMRNSHQTTHDGEQQTNSSHTLCVCREFMIAFARMLWKHAVGVVRSISAASAPTPPSGLWMCSASMRENSFECIPLTSRGGNIQKGKKKIVLLGNSTLEQWKVFPTPGGKRKDNFQCKFDVKGRHQLQYKFFGY